MLLKKMFYTKFHIIFISETIKFIFCNFKALNCVQNVICVYFETKLLKTPY